MTGRPQNSSSVRLDALRTEGWRWRATRVRLYPVRQEPRLPLRTPRPRRPQARFPRLRPRRLAQLRRYSRAELGVPSASQERVSSDFVARGGGVMQFHPFCPPALPFLHVQPIWLALPFCGQTSSGQPASSVSRMEPALPLEPWSSSSFCPSLRSCRWQPFDAETVPVSSVEPLDFPFGCWVEQSFGDNSTERFGRARTLRRDASEAHARLPTRAIRLMSKVPCALQTY